MAQPQSPFVKITESRVFQVTLPEGRFNLVLLSGEYVADAMAPYIRIPVKAPVTLYNMPPQTWHALWPTEIEPPGWNNVRVADDHIILTPNMSRPAVGGLVAYLSADERVPINGQTTVTCFNGPQKDQQAVPLGVQRLWQSLWADMEPRLPAQDWSRAVMRSYVTAQPTMLSNITAGAPRDLKVLGSYLGSGIGTAVLAGLLIILVARNRMLKTT
jgi:hypothetical protein